MRFKLQRYCRLNTVIMTKVLERTFVWRQGFIRGSLVAQLANDPLSMQSPGFNPWVGKTLWRRDWQPTPGLSMGEPHGQRSLVGCRPWGLSESDGTE